MLITFPRQKKWLRERALTLRSYIHCHSGFHYRTGHGSICAYLHQITPLHDSLIKFHSKLQVHYSASDFR